MGNLPDKLTRRAVKRCFEALTEGRWEWLFEHEADNGLAACRVDGPFKKAYYSTPRLAAWLITEGYYRPEDFERKTSAFTVRTHVLAG